MTPNVDIWPPYESIHGCVCAHTQTKPVYTNEQSPGSQAARQKGKNTPQPLTSLLPPGRLIRREATAIRFGFLLFHRLFRYTGRLIYNGFKNTPRYSLDQRVAEGGSTLERMGLKHSDRSTAESSSGKCVLVHVPAWCAHQVLAGAQL